MPKAERKVFVSQNGEENFCTNCRAQKRKMSCKCVQIQRENANENGSRKIRSQGKEERKEKGKFFYKIDPYYPSSQTCSVCDNIDKKYKDIKERTYICNRCQNTLDRDLNASINIMFEGLKLYMSEKYI